MLDEDVKVAVADLLLVPAEVENWTVVVVVGVADHHVVAVSEKCFFLDFRLKNRNLPRSMVMESIDFPSRVTKYTCTKHASVFRITHC